MSSQGPSTGRSWPTPSRLLLLLPVLAATAALWWIVPEWSLSQLDDPSYWGVLGFVVAVVLICKHTVAGRGSPAATRRLLVVFLVAMPVVYLADWLRFGGSRWWLAVELAGAALFWGVAYLSVSRAQWWLPLGIAGHALWDAAHYQVQTFVPTWYIFGCVVADLGVGIFAIWSTPATQGAGPIGGHP